MTKSHSKKIEVTITPLEWPYSLPPKDEDAAVNALIEWLRGQEIKPTEAVPVLARGILNAIRSCTHNRDDGVRLAEIVGRTIRDTLMIAETGDEEW